EKDQTQIDLDRHVPRLRPARRGRTQPMAPGRQPAMSRLRRHPGPADAEAVAVSAGGRHPRPGAGREAEVTRQSEDDLVAEALGNSLAALTAISERSSDPWSARRADDALHEAKVILGGGRCGQDELALVQPRGEPMTEEHAIELTQHVRQRM